MASIFISYRRTDAAGHAGRLYDQLAARFGEANIFKDLDSMEPGADFAEVIEETVERCDVFIAVIGSDWLSPRLEDPADWVRLEIAHALGRKVRVVPVLVEGAKMPASSELPEDLRALSRRHAVDLSETGWNAQVRELIDRLESLTAPASGDRAEPVAEPSPEPDGWSAEVHTNTKRDRKLELWTEHNRLLITVHAGRVTDKVTLNDQELAFAAAEPKHCGLVAPFPLTTPSGESIGVVHWLANFTRLLWVSVYVDLQPVYREPGSIELIADMLGDLEPGAR